MYVCMAAGVQFELEPHVRFQGAPGEQWTMFLRDPSGEHQPAGHTEGTAGAGRRPPPGASHPIDHVGRQCILRGQSGVLLSCVSAALAGNALEFKAMTNPDNLFAKYTVVT